MSTDTETLLRAMYDAWRRQDIDFVAANLPDDIVHDIKISPEVHPLGGLRAGKAAVLERLAALGADFEIQDYDVGCLAVSERHAAAEIHIRYRHRRTGLPFESSMAHVGPCATAGRWSSPNITTPAASWLSSPEPPRSRKAWSVSNPA